VLRRLILIILLALCAVRSVDALPDRTSRLSASVTFVHQSLPLPAFFVSPGLSSYEARVMFPADLAPDVWFGIDQELLEGNESPIHFAGADWMGFVALKRDGTVGTPVGSAESHAGDPDDGATWTLHSLGVELQPDTWYRIRSVVDFAALEFVSFSVEGGGIDTELDLGGNILSFPNYIPIDGPSMTYYTHSLRTRDSMQPGSTTVLFDDVRASVWYGGAWAEVYRGGFEDQVAYDDVPFTYPALELARVGQGTWYKERAEAIVYTDILRPLAGRHALACDATLDPPPAKPHLRWFGFLGIDCGIDDPWDPAPVTNYLDEVADFSNLGELCATDPSEDLAPRLDAFAARGVRPLVKVQDILFDSSPDGATPSGNRVRLRADHAARWAQFAALNATSLGSLSEAAFQLVDRPTWNGLSAPDLETAADLVDATFPDLQILLVEEGGSLGGLVVPATVDWIGFRRFGTIDPFSDAGYLAAFDLLKSKRSSPHQRLALIVEAQYNSDYEQGGYPPEAMANVAVGAWKLASREPLVEAVLVYTWPGGIEEPVAEHLGLRALPEAVRAAHREFGLSASQWQDPLDVATVSPLLSAPRPVEGLHVGTAGWEDGLCVSPDGQWLHLQYIPMTAAGVLLGDPGHPWARVARGPWRGPDRPGFFAARIADDGTITHSYPLLGIEPGQLLMVFPPNCLYGFRRQGDRGFRSPVRIGFDDDDNGNLGPYGPSIPTGVPVTGVTTPFLFTFDTPVTSGEDNVVHRADLPLGVPTLLGGFERDLSGTITASFDLTTVIGPTGPGRIGNPHLHVGGPIALASLWSDDEGAAERDLFVAQLLSGDPASGTWSSKSPLPAPVCEVGVAETQPFFDGSDLYYRRESMIMRSRYLGGDPANAGAWSAPAVLLAPAAGWPLGKVGIVGEPSVAVLPDGRRELYFIYGIRQADGSFDLGPGVAEMQHDVGGGWSLW
jgi:hypothetical protein